jgi:hypothetical protein
LRAEGFFCNLDIRYGGLGIGKLLFLIKKKKFSAIIFFQFFVIKALDPDWIRIRIGVQPKLPDPDEMNADPQPWSNLRSGTPELELGDWKENRKFRILAVDNGILSFR